MTSQRTGTKSSIFGANISFGGKVDILPIKLKHFRKANFCMSNLNNFSMLILPPQSLTTKLIRASVKCYEDMLPKKYPNFV